MKKQPVETRPKKEVDADILPKYDTKSWFKSGFLGVFIGLAVIVPGLSGATISIIFKLYDKLIYAVSHIFKKFKISIIFLIPVLLGAIVGFIGGFFGVKQGLEYAPFALVCLFGGLMIGSFPAVIDEIKGQKATLSRWGLLALGFIVPTLITVLITLYAKEGTTAADLFTEIPWWFFFAALLIGFAVAITQAVPGLSATALLMAIGLYRALLDSASLTFWFGEEGSKGHPAVFGVYACLIVGFLLGFFFTAKVLNNLLAKKRASTFYFVTGLSASAIVCMFYNPEMSPLYKYWITGKDSGGFDDNLWYGSDVGIGMALLVVGIAIAFALVVYQRKQAGKKAELPKKLK